MIELGPDSAAPGAKIVVEAKEEEGYSLANAREEIETARKNRDADWGVFVFSKKTAPASLEPFSRYGSDFVVVWDAEDASTDVFLKAGIIAARALCFRAERQSAAQQVDFEAIDKAILGYRKTNRQSRRCAKIGRDNPIGEHQNSRTSPHDREALEKQVEILREKVKDLRDTDDSVTVSDRERALVRRFGRRPGNLFVRRFHSCPSIEVTLIPAAASSA